jgi:formylglycine-generating enzyme required for sulfatase activity
MRQMGDITMTYDGEVVGTPAYMSPEQATGSHVDGRADIYSVGVILFELLTGEKPFRGNHRMLLHQVVNEEAPSPRRLNGSIPRDLETICLKCLEKTPARRYPSAQELAEDLRRFLGGEPIRARPVRAIERMWKWAARRPLVASLLTAFVLAVVLGLSGVIWQWQKVLASQRRHALTQVDLIRHAEPSEVESAISGLHDFRQWADPELRKLASNEGLPGSDRFRGHLALIEHEPESVEFVIELLLRVAPPDVLDFDELALGTDLLAKADAVPKSDLVELATDSNQEEALRFRALFMLARTAESSREQAPWDEEVKSFAVHHLVSRATTAPEYYRTLVDAFRPVHSILLAVFRDLLASDIPDRNERFTAAAIVGEYAADRPEFLCDLLLEVRPAQYRVILPRLLPHREEVEARLATVLSKQSDSEQQDDLVARKAVAAITLLHLDVSGRSVWPLFRQSPNMRLRTHLIHRCADSGVPPEKLIARLRTESDVSVRRAILLALGEYDELAAAVRNDLRPVLEGLYRGDPDAGVHSAVAWLLRSWGEEDVVRAMDGEPQLSGPITDRKWYVNSEGTTMVIIDHPPVFMMGSPEDEPLRTKFDRQHLRKVDRKFAIATTEVTWKQFQRFVADYPTTNHSHPETYGPDPDGPVLAVSWVHAAKYCRWLSEQEDIPPDRMCFPELDEIEVGLSLPDDFMERTGYRLPTEGEWECACRAGTVTRRFFGDSDEFLDSYGWHIGNSNDYAWRVGLLKPNDYGLFDIYGNAWEWCLDRQGSLPTRPAGDPFLDVAKLIGTKPRMLRGGSMNSRADALRSAQRDFIDARHDRNHNVGFRIVRTLPD